MTRTIVLKSFIFGGFAPSGTGKNWHTSAHGWPIPADILQRVRFQPFLLITAPILILTWLVFLSNAAFSQEQIDEFVARLFDKGVPTTCADNLPLPFCRDNPPPSLRTLIVLIFYLHDI
jgi:hypothetical protein